MRQKNTKRATKRIARKRGAAEPTEYIEKGHEVLDLAAGERNDKRAANQVMAVMEAEIVPRWLREAIAENLAEAARRIGSPNLVPVLADGKVSVVPNDNPFYQDARKNLKTLISLTQSEFTLRLSERATLAHAISTVLHSEETPVLLYNSVADFIADISTPLIDDSPETIERALNLEAEPVVGRIVGRIVGHKVRASKKGGGHAAN